MTQGTKNIDKIDSAAGKTPAVGFSMHEDLNTYLEDQKKLEETTQQHKQTADMMDRLAAEDEARRKEQQKQTTANHSNEEAEQTSGEEAVQAAPANPPPSLEEILCKLYGTSYLSELYVGKLNDFSLVRTMPDKDDQDKLAMVAVKHDKRVFELTETHVITKAGLDAQAAYDLALHAKLNPKLAEGGVSMLPGSDTDRVLLYFAAQAFGLKVNNADELTEEQKANPPQEWLAFLATLTDHPSPEAGAEEDQPQEPPKDEADPDGTSYEADDQKAEAETKPEPEQEQEQEQEPEMIQGISIKDQPVDTELYGSDSFNTGQIKPNETDEMPTMPTSEAEHTEPAAGQPETKEAIAEEQDDILLLPAPSDSSTTETEEAPNKLDAYIPKTEERACGETEETLELTAKEVTKAPVPEETMTALFNANVGKKTYMEARKQVINEGKASRSFLRDAFDLTDRQAKAVQAALRDENIIAKEGSNRHVVLIQPS